MESSITIEKMKDIANKAKPYEPDELAFDDPNVDMDRLWATLAQDLIDDN